MKLPSRTARVILCSTGLCIVSSFADDSTRVVELDRMVVRDKRTWVLAYDHLDSTLISRPSASHSIDGLLTHYTGIDVKRSSPSAGKGRGVTVRGFDESRFLILLDGRPLNGSGVMGGDYVDWSSLSSDNVHEIEVIRGPKSAEYGNSLGGVINIITRAGKNVPEKTQVTASYGLFSPEHAEDIIENRKTRLSFSHHAHIGDKASYNVFSSLAQGEPFLRNNDYSTTQLGGDVLVDMPFAVVLRAAVRQSRQNRGFAIANHRDSSFYDDDYPESDGSAGGGPGIKWNTIPSKGGADSLYFGDRSNWKNIRTQTDFSLSKEWRNTAISAQLYGNNQRRTEYYYAITDTNKLILERFSKPEDYTWGWNVKVRQLFREKHTVRYGLEGSALRYNNTDIRSLDTSYFAVQPSDGPDERIRAADRYSAFVQSRLSLHNRVVVTPGLRYDYYLGNKRESTVGETPLHGVSPNGGMVVQTWTGGEASVHGAYRHRFPTCPELYWFYGGHSFAGRKDLSPERAVQFEAGFSQKLRTEKEYDVSFGLRGYHYHVSDYIRTVFGGRPVPPLQPKASRLIYNIDKVLLTGIEAETKTRVHDRLLVWANYTWQITQKTGDAFDSSTVYANGLPELPEHKANGGVEVILENGATAGLSMRFVGRRDVIQESFSKSGAIYETVDAFSTFRLFAVYPVYSSDVLTAKFNLGIDNLFNTGYEEDPGIPMPGMTPTIGIAITF